MNKRFSLLVLVFSLLVASPLLGQDETPEDATRQSGSGEASQVVDPAASGTTSQETPGIQVEQKLEDVTEKVNQNPTAQKATSDILKGIYSVAENYLSFAGFYWLAFMLMVAGLISFALQLVLGKLFALLQFHFSPVEILSDGLGFLISAIGLVLTTQAATENSDFTQSPAMVLSAAGVGIVLGLVFYVRGQTQEFREAREVRRRHQVKKPA